VSFFFLSGMERFQFQSIRLCRWMDPSSGWGRSFRSSADFVPGGGGGPLISSGTLPAVQHSGSILWISFLRARFMRILYIRTRNV
jgi:hypothetical protein